MEWSMQHAVVTGAGSGIGEAISRSLMQAGCKVTLMGRREAPLQAVIEQSPSGKSNAQAITCDVSDMNSTDTAFEQAAQSFGGVTVLVNCAGMAPTQPFHKLTSDEWRAVMAVNLDGVFHCTQQVISSMLQAKQGRIINIASTASLVGYAYVSAYCAAKHGVLGLTRALALEVAKKGITVNAICPGYTDTDIIRNAVSNIMQKTGRTEAQALESFTSSNPQGRLIDPQEVADTVLWLCSNSSRSVTGQAISLSGGEVM